MANQPPDVAGAIKLAHRHHLAGEFHQAEQLYRSVLNADPENAEANHLLGVLAHQHGNYDIAVQLIAKAVLKDAGKATYLNNLGLAVEAQGKPDQALMLYEQAIALDPEFTGPRVNSGIALQALGRLDEAVAAFDRALTMNPDHADANNSRGLVLLAQRQITAALESFDRALSIDPNFAEAHNNRGNALEAQGRITDALMAYRRALDIRPDFSGAHSNLLLCLHYDSNTDAQTISNAHRHWDTRHAHELSKAARPHTNSTDPERRLRIGYVSADFCSHPVAAFLEPLLASHDHVNFDVVCYANVVRPDEVTERLRRSAASWRSIRGMSEARVAELVEQDGIDILVDLSGHTAGHRLLVFARKPAPIQVTYLGYPGTSGLSAMDYRFSDVWTDPPGAADELYTEELVRLPQGCLCYQPPQSAPEVTTLLELTPGNITFASFNNAAKVSSETVALWATVLSAVPQARLMMKSKAFGDRETVERLLRIFNEHGVVSERLEFISWLPASEAHLALYNRAHVALDTFPYSGCTTTCEALWMGVPVITLARDEPRSRMSLSILSQIGLDDCIAQSPQAYVDTATSLATDINKLRELRAGLRARMQQSSLLDASAFARTVESAYRDMWKQFCSDR